jgi:hypothetical protein
MAGVGYKDCINPIKVKGVISHKTFDDIDLLILGSKDLGLAPRTYKERREQLTERDLLESAKRAFLPRYVDFLYTTGSHRPISLVEVAMWCACDG